jgi:hypothetical protein
MTFKGFPATVLMNFTFPLVRKIASGKRDDLADVGLTFGMGLALGATVLQAKLIAKGEEPRDMDDPKFFMAAAMQAGGLGIFGDFLFADMSRFNQSYVTTLAGPVAGIYGDGLKIINANFNRAISEGEESQFALDAFNYVSRYIPGASLWYARLPVERFILDSIERTIDPKFDKKVRRKEKQMMRDEGRGYWWKP